MLRKFFSLFHTVDEVTNQADQINQLLYGEDGFDEAGFVQKTYGMNLSQCRRLSVLIMRYQDQTLGGFGVRRLQRLLNTNSSALSYYADFQHLTAMLILHFRGDPALPNILSACSR